MRNEEAENAFHQLKQAMTNTPVLTMPDFSKEFVTDSDASSTGLEAVLLQGGRPIAYVIRIMCSLKYVNLFIL